MKCPIDNNDLQMAERQGVEIDYCPKCRGVWLDRGELDKIIERAEKNEPAPQNTPRPAYPEPGYGNNSGGHHGYKRRKSWIGELFD